jgi:hypothetical protein
MARDAALITTWSSTIPGREAKSLEVFMEVLTFVGKQAADGRCSEPEVWFNADGSEGMLIVRGKSDVLLEIQETDDYQRLLSKSHMIVEDLKAHLWYGGSDDELQRGIRLFSEAGNELGYM